MNLCGSQNQITLIRFPFSLSASGQLQFSWVRLDLPREGKAFAVPQLPAESSSVGLARLLLKDKLFQRLSILKESSPSLSLVLALLVNTSHL